MNEAMYGDSSRVTHMTTPDHPLEGMPSWASDLDLLWNEN